MLTLVSKSNAQIFTFSLSFQSIFIYCTVNINSKFDNVDSFKDCPSNLCILNIKSVEYTVQTFHMLPKLSIVTSFHKMQIFLNCRFLSGILQVLFSLLYLQSFHNTSLVLQIQMFSHQMPVYMLSAFLISACGMQVQSVFKV